MDKQALLQELTTRLESGELSREEIIQAIDDDSLSLADDSRHQLPSALSTALYFIGGGIVFLGMVFLIAQEWQGFSAGMRIFVTFGSGIAAFVVGVLFTSQQRLGAAGPAFFLLSALLLPAGLFVTYDEFGINISLASAQIQIAGILFVTYLAAYLLMRRNVLLVFAMIFGSWLFLASMDFMVRGNPILDDWRFFSYSILLLGLAYMLLAFSFTNTERNALSGWLYAIGVLGFLSAGFALGGWKPSQSAFWEAIYPGLVFAIIFLSTHLKRKSLLVFGSLALGSWQAQNLWSTHAVRVSGC